MQLPPFLQSGDTIAIAATARKMNELSWTAIEQCWQQLGFRVKAAPYLLAESNQFAGTDEERAQGFLQAWTDPEVKAVQILRGGYGSARMVDLLEDALLQRHPKWLLGYSDVTVLHARLQRLGMISLHTTMPVNMLKNDSDTVRSNTALVAALTGNWQQLELPEHPLNRTASLEGTLVGGNLSVLYSLLGSADMPDLQGKILFLEDLDEYLYHIDRMMRGLYRAGFFKGVKAILVGGLTEMKDNTIPYGKTAEAIVAEYAHLLEVPVWFGLPVGHQPLNLPLLLGAKVTLNSRELRFQLEK